LANHENILKIVGIGATWIGDTGTIQRYVGYSFSTGRSL
jgi:hypothetical protein